MVRGVSFSVAVAAWMLTGQQAYAGNISDGSQLYRAAIHVAVSGLEQLIANATSAIGRFMVDGGGDGGGDGGSDGSDGGDTGDSDSTSGDTSSSDGPSDPADSVTSQANTTVSDPSDPTPIETPEEIAIEAIPTTDPRGGFDPENLNSAYPTGRDDSASETNEIGGISTGNPVGGPGVKAPVDVGINAVIVSGAQSPWDAIGKVSGVGTVTVTGGIIALGKTPIQGEPPGGGPQPPWLRLVPDLKLLNGSVIPPVVPNVIDVRIIRYSVEAVEKPNN
jgi:hypothetical protein